MSRNRERDSRDKRSHRSRSKDRGSRERDNRGSRDRDRDRPDDQRMERYDSRDDRDRHDHREKETAKERRKRKKKTKFSAMPEASQVDWSSWNPAAFVANADATSSTSTPSDNPTATTSSSFFAPPSAPTNSTPADPNEKRVVVRKSRFTEIETPSSVPIPTTIGDLQKEAMRIQLELQTVTAKLCAPYVQLPPPEERSPSPEPEYDNRGQRSNLREQRERRKLALRRDQLIAEALKLPPQFRPAGVGGGASRGSLRYDKKVFIPYQDYPDENFVGLIIGPRGSTQKRLESQTGCKISVRGKGGAKDKANKRGPQPGDDEELHVYIQGDTPDRVDQTAQLIQKLLSNSDEAMLFKADQMREIARINGVVADVEMCRVCGGTGHKVYACPGRSLGTWRPADIMCEKCGSGMHLTIDCPQMMDANGKLTNLADFEEKTGKEYAAFLEETTGEKLPPNFFMKKEDVRKLPEFFDDNSGYIFPLVDTGHVYVPGQPPQAPPPAAPKAPPVPPPPSLPRGKKPRKRKPKPGADQSASTATMNDANVTAEDTGESAQGQTEIGNSLNQDGIGNDGGGSNAS